MLVVNLFGGPGTGKSSLASVDLYSRFVNNIAGTVMANL